MKLFHCFTLYLSVESKKNKNKGKGSVIQAETPQPEKFVDDILYTRRVLDELAASGVDVSNYKEAVLMQGKDGARGIQHVFRWHELTENDKIAIPYSYHSSVLEYQSEIDAAMAAMSIDLGCMEMVKVPYDELATNPWTNGLLFTWATETVDGCFSALGVAPGSTGDWDKNHGDIETLGAKPEWQVINLDSYCQGSSKETLQHEVMHAIGFRHEHQRADRDEYITVHYETIEEDWHGQFDKLPYSSDGNNKEWDDVKKWFWEDSGHPFELGSVMTYCSDCSGSPAMTLKADGSKWGSHGGITTTDALQVQWLYCRDRSEYEYKSTLACPTADRTGQMLQVFSDRLCDNVKDCYGGEDEGSMGECKPFGEVTQNGCCQVIMFDGQECVYDRQFMGKDGYLCANGRTLKNVKKMNVGLEGWVYADADAWSETDIWYYEELDQDTTCPNDGEWSLGAKIECKLDGLLHQTTTTTTTSITSTTHSTSTTSTVAPFENTCRDVTTGITRTNSWTCRDCYNLRVNFNLESFADNWIPHVYISFSEETAVVKVAGPAAAIDYEGLDRNGDHMYKVTFLAGHEFGDNRIDFNAEFRELAGQPLVSWAWTCPLVANQCDEVMNPFEILGDGSWSCSQKRSGRTTSCKAVCADGKNAYNKNTKARCNTYTNNNSVAGKWVSRSGGLVSSVKADCRLDTLARRQGKV